MINILKNGGQNHTLVKNRLPVIWNKTKKNPEPGILFPTSTGRVKNTHNSGYNRDHFSSILETPLTTSLVYLQR